MNANHSTPSAAGPACAAFGPFLPLLSLGRLDDDEARPVREHAATCVYCRAALAQYDALRDALRLPDVYEGPVAPVNQVPTLENIMSLTTQHPPTDTLPAPIRSPQRPPSRLGLLGALAAVLVVAALAGLIFAMHGPLGTVLSGPTPTATTPSTATTPPASRLMQPTWKLTRLVVDGSDQPLVASRVPTLRFGPHEGQFYGNGSCNDYGGSYTLAGDTLHVSELYYTQVYCMPVNCTLADCNGLIEQEDAYFQALPRIARYRLSGATLTLSSADGRSADGSVQLTFQAN